MAGMLDVYNSVFQEDLFVVEHHVAKQFSCCKFDDVDEAIKLDKAWRLGLSKRGMKMVAFSRQRNYKSKSNFKFLIVV